MLLGHGWDKLMNYAKYSGNFPDPLGIGPSLSLSGAIVGEVVASAALILGFCTRLSALVLVFTMAVAALFHHQLGDAFFPKMEPAMIYLMAFLALVLFGGGRFSVDRLLWRKGS